MQARKRAGSGGNVGIFIGGGAALLLVLAVAAWWVFLRSTPQRTVRDYLAACKAGNEQAARSFLSTESIKALDAIEKSFPQLAAMGGSVKLATNLVVPVTMDADVGVGKASISGTSATVDVKMKPRDAGNKMMARLAQTPRPVKCIREGGKWKIDAAQDLKMVQQFMGVFASQMGSSMEQMAKQFGATMPTGATPSSAGSATMPPATPAPAASGADAGALIAEGLAAKQAADYATAVSKFSEALAAEPNNADAHWGLAWVLADQGKKAEAVQHFQQVMKLSSDPTRQNEAQEAINRLQ